MSRTPSPSELKDVFKIRMPEGMRDRIAERAAAEHRSMNTLIVSVVDQYLKGDLVPSAQASNLSPLEQDEIRRLLSETAKQIRSDIITQHIDYAGRLKEMADEITALRNELVHDTKKRANSR